MGPYSSSSVLKSIEHKLIFTFLSLNFIVIAKLPSKVVSQGLGQQQH